MKFVLSMVAVVFMFVPAMSQDNGVAESKDGHYGGVIIPDMPEYTLSHAIEDGHVNNTANIKATVTEVCQVKGCWMKLKDGDHEIRVTFKDYGFFVPSSLAGKEVIIQGVLKEEVISEADRRHYAQDAGASEEEIEKIKGDAKEYTFEATGVQAQ